MDIVDGWETVGNSLGRAPLGTVGNRLGRAPLEGARRKRGHHGRMGNCLGRGSDILRSRAVGKGFQETNSINAIVPKNCPPKTFQVVCKRFGRWDMHSFVGREEITEQSYWHGFFRTNSINAIVPKNWCQRLLKRGLNAGQRDLPDMHGKKFFAGGVFILHGVLSVDAWFSPPLQRSKLNDNPSIGYASA